MSSNPVGGDSPQAGQGRRQPGMAPQQQQQQQQLQLQQQRESSAGPSSAGGDPSASDRSGSFSMGLGFLKGLGGDKKSREGQAQKRRGPKPDSKPALTRRQELNRQAQRTHRERKEFYIKSLEHEVMQLKEVYTGTVQEKNAFEKENTRLKELLRVHGIAFDESQSNLGFTPQQATGGPSSSYGLGGSNFSPATQYPSSSASPEMFGGNEAFDPSAFHPQGAQQHDPTGFQSHQPPQALALQAPQRNQSTAARGNLDYDQLGVDFVLALEAACMDHLQYMCVRSATDAEEPPNGHALMMSCPPPSHIALRPDEPYPHRAPPVPAPDLNRLLELAQTLTVDDGEITPVIALLWIRQHPRFHELSARDFEVLRNELRGKTRCYGFGAVLEEFELRDALQSVFATKLESYATWR